MFLACTFLAAMTLCAYAADVAGTYNGTVQLEQSIPSINQTVSKSGNVEIKITNQSDDKYEVLIKTKIPDLPDTDDKNVYTLSGSTLTLHQETNISGIQVDTDGTFTVSGDSITGEVKTIGKTNSDGTVQTSSVTTFNAKK